MSNLEKAMQVEQQLRNENNYNVRTLAPLVKEFGYNTAKEYLEERNAYLFQNWKPEVFYIDIAEYAEVTEDAVQNGKYGIYISNGEGVHAYHGTDTIDYDLCNELGVRVVELNYQGGTIIGSAKDFSIIVVAPTDIHLEPQLILDKFQEIISKYVPETTASGNDILVNGDKVAGSMTRQVGDSFVWATQVTFDDYSEYIKKICNKTAIKKPVYIDNTLLTRDQLEKDILDWLVEK